MKKLLQIPLLLVALFLTTIPISAHDFEVDGIYYNILTDSTVEVTYRGDSYSNYSNEYADTITIPSSVTYCQTTYSVISVGKYAFRDCSSLTSIIISNAVEKIDDAFYNCENLTDIVIPYENSINIISGSAFWNTGWYKNQADGILYYNMKLSKNGKFYVKRFCLGIKGTEPSGELVLDGATTLIADRAFMSCDDLTSVNIGNSVVSIGEEAFKFCYGLTSVAIGNSVSYIGNNAFYYCSNLTKVNISDISAWCKIDFGGGIANPLCYAKHLYLNGSEIIDLVIPNDVTEINNDTFLNCLSIASVTIPESVTAIGNDAFSGCSNIARVKLPASLKKINENTFYGCVKLTSIEIPHSVSLIGGGAFFGCSNLTELLIPNSVDSIGYGAFGECISLRRLTIEDGDKPLKLDCNRRLYNVGEGLFYDCPIDSINLNRNLQYDSCSDRSSGYSPFYSNTNIKRVTIGNQIDSIGSFLFGACTGLTTVNFNAENCTGGDNMFHNCSSLRTLNISDKVKRIPSLAFYETLLTEVTIPSSVTNIDWYAFYSKVDILKVYISDLESYCNIDFNGFAWKHVQLYLNNDLLKDLVIPGTITQINPYSFYGCYCISSLSLHDALTEIGNSAFFGCFGIKNISIPNSVRELGYAAFGNCSNISSILIPNVQTNVKYDSFYGCSKLLYSNINTGITKASISLTTPTTYSMGVNYNNTDYEAIDGVVEIDNLKPGSEVLYGCRSHLVINNTNCQISDLTFKTKSFEIDINGSVSASSVTAVGSHTIGDITVLGTGINAGGDVTEYTNVDSITLTNLDPNSSYTIYYAVNTQEGGVYSTSETFTTSALELTTQEAKPTSTTSVRLLAATNCDATEGTGFEWRRYDAPDELPSSKVSCPVVDGVLVGSLRGVKDDVYYKYRPYYTSSSGKTYYGEWIAFFTGDANVYFEPDVRTYDDIQVINNSATVKGYALEGTDVITAQGFEYWKTGSTITPSSTENRMIVNASGISMSATLANLEYNSTYKYRAFVTTAQGTTYGDEVEFSTGNDPAGIDYIEIDADEFSVTLRENPATGTAWVKILGTAGEEVQYTITSMSGAMIATGTVMLDGEWNAIDLNCSAGIYLLTINDGTQVRTVRLIVK